MATPARNDGACVRKQSRSGLLLAILGQEFLIMVASGLPRAQGAFLVGLATVALPAASQEELRTHLALGSRAWRLAAGARA